MSRPRTAAEWAAHDPDPVTREALTATIAAAEAGDAAALAELDLAFAGPITFGTAGLRGEVGPGESRMNVATVTRATKGLMDHLTTEIGEGPRVVVGCDARTGSHEFFRVACEVISAAGGRAMALPEHLPTPVLAHATLALDADAGIMITASHNPPADNGYKVYLGGRVATGPAAGVQIVPPVDSEIAACIADAPPADEIARSTDMIEAVSLGLVDSYVSEAAGLATAASGPAEASANVGSPESGAGTPARDVRIVLTPLHGVGGATARAVLERAGFTDVHVVGEQAQPDPAFPTVSFPNPEEPGALDLALELARDVEADVVIALDPDADRCSVAVPTPGSVPGASGASPSAADPARGWRQLTGDEIGAVLGDQAAADDTRPGRVLANSLVSSRLLLAIAAAHGLEGVQTLTGFKWIARTPALRFGYEEAIGYCTAPAMVRDKDGITAMVRVATLVAELKQRGRSLQDELDHLARQHGLYATRQVSFRVQDLSLIADGIARLREHPPAGLVGSAVVETADLADGYRGLPPTDGMLLRTEDDTRLIVRPSGTEPKLKCYLEVVLPVPGDGEVPNEHAADRLDRLAAEITATLGF